MKASRTTGLRFAVRVPASTSNLGPGFDFLGLAFGMELGAELEWLGDPPSPHRVEYHAPPAWDPDADLVLQTLAAYEVRFGLKLPPCVVRVHSDIPVGRGFGSSGAAVAATLLLAAAVAERVSAEGGHGSTAPTTEDLVKLAKDIEGHPDNGTASLMGGCTLAVPVGDDVMVVQSPVHGSLGLAVAWPDAPLFTPAARAALPTEVPFADAVENPRRLALLLEGLRTGDPTLLRAGVEDRLHERNRRALIPGSHGAIQAALGAGAAAACLSGAGSGIVALGEPQAMARVAEAMAQALPGGQGRAVVIAHGAPRASLSGAPGSPI